MLRSLEGHDARRQGVSSADSRYRRVLTIPWKCINMSRKNIAGRRQYSAISEENRLDIFHDIDIVRENLLRGNGHRLYTIFFSGAIDGEIVDDVSFCHIASSAKGKEYLIERGEWAKISESSIYLLKHL